MSLPSAAQTPTHCQGREHTHEYPPVQPRNLPAGCHSGAFRFSHSRAPLTPFQAENARFS